ncbi:uncharacterized protein LOC112202300 isoform X4 [Rosa chinensis]|uniref:uncharacterized protein LOC112202300 isoform X4 n=1 Tax=Rosa chinensis TaxID=74649 RepID=UPI001AD91B92|nr:uncharacterized protein LOC112202300 isoform X4 [Rosa chinensis]
MSVSVNSSDQVCENGTAELLPATNDDHGGVIVDMKDAMEPQAFRALLRASIVQWRLQGKKGVWIKLPIELVNLVEMVVKGEDITVAAVREVKEETGIDAEFSEVLAFRQAHKKFFEKSDLFFVCMMRPLSFDIQKQDLEIEAAKWISLEEFAAQPVTQKHGLFKCIHELCLAKLALLPEPGGRRRMFPLKLAVFFTALCLSVFSNLVFIKEISGDATPSSPSANCVTCTTCQYPCPPAGGDPLYPPPPPSQTGEYPPPPPPPPPQQPSHQGKCPPGQYQCCQYPQGYSPPGPIPQYLTPPGTFGGGGGGYVPYPYNSASSSPLSVLLSVLVMMLFSSAVFL